MTSVWVFTNHETNDIAVFDSREKAVAFKEKADKYLGYTSTYDYDIIEIFLNPTIEQYFEEE